MTDFLATRHEPRSEPGRFAEGVGLAVVILGLAQATGVVGWLIGPGVPASGIAGPLMLAMALMIAWLSAFTARESEGRMALDYLVAGLGLLAVLAGVCRIAVDADLSHMPLSGHALPWAALFGIAGMIMFTWRLWGRWLALAATLAFLFAATWHAVTWRPDLTSQHATSLDAALDMAATLWFDRADGMFGWSFDVLLSSVFPVFVLGKMLAGRTFRGSPTGSEPSASRFLEALHGSSLLLIPTLAIGSLFMMERPGIDLWMIALVWLLPLATCLAWFWISPPPLPTAVGRPDVMAISVTFLVLVLALVSGVSIQFSAIIALGVIIAFSFFDASVRRRPSVVPLALARSGIAFGKLLVAAGAVGLILAVLDHSGLPIDVARLLAGAAGEAPLPLLVAATMVAIAAGLVMPGFAAYLIVAALLSPSLRTVGIADPASHALILAVSTMTVAIGHGLRSKTA